ncbi:hypothetical protein GCM10010470_40910 [Saccharopolyspora taberi]|uniref:Uncharacterized protein n=1 Tax=Saccharopolyspora taberi TaxID=60895 RepID=A0ABN3VG06_9PSEU
MPGGRCCTQRAEHEMNVALEARRWTLVQRHRQHMLAVAEDQHRRARDLEQLADVSGEPQGR